MAGQVTVVQKFKSSTKRQQAAFVALALAILWICLSTPAEAAEPKRGGSLRFGIKKNLATLNPFVLMQSVDHRVRSLLYENFLAYDRNLDPVPGLARSWSVSPDALTYTFTLRADVKFHNGKPLSPSDIKWSIEYAQDPKNQAFGRAELMIIDKVEVEEPDRVRIRLKSPFSPFLSAVAGIHLFPVVPKDSVQQAESQRDALPPGTGPFAFAAWRPGQELKLSRHAGYWQKGLPYLDEVRFVIVIDDTTRMNAIRAGDLDIGEEVPEEQIRRIREGKLPGVGIAIAPAGTTRRLGINHCRPPFNNIKVRQALAYALDKQEIIEGAYSGLATPTNQKLFRGTRWFVSELAERKQDFARSKSLLAEAGYPNGVKVTIDGSPGSEKELQVVQTQAKKAGIEMTLQIRDYPTYMAAIGNADFQIYVGGGSTHSDPDLVYYGYYHTPAKERRDKGGRNQPCYSNGKVDQLLEDARKVTDFQQRRRIYKEVIEILHEEIPDLPIAFTQNGFGFQNQVRDFEPTITSVYSYGNGGILKTWLDPK